MKMSNPSDIYQNHSVIKNNVTPNRKWKAGNVMQTENSIYI